MLRKYINNHPVSSIMIHFNTSLSYMFKEINRWKLSCMQLIPYENEKGLVSENYLAVTRLYKWIASFLYQYELTHYKKVYAIFENSDISMEWPREKMKAVLANLGSIYSGNKKELLEKLIEEKKKTIKDRLSNVSQLAMILSSFHSIAAMCMASTYDDDLTQRQKLEVIKFLTLMTKYSPRSVQKKYNFVSLLNLPSMMREFGPIRESLWEGGMKGEKFLSILKPLIHKNSAKWEKIALANCYVSQNVNDFCDEMYRKLPYETMRRYYRHRVMVKERVRRAYNTLSSYDDFIGRIRDRQPISCIVSNNKIFVAACTRPRELCRIQQ